MDETIREILSSEFLPLSMRKIAPHCNVSRDIANMDNEVEREEPPMEQMKLDFDRRFSPYFSNSPLDLARNSTRISSLRSPAHLSIRNSTISANHPTSPRSSLNSSLRGSLSSHRSMRNDG